MRRDCTQKREKVIQINEEAIKDHLGKLVRFVFDLDSLGLDLGVQTVPPRQRQVLRDHPVGVAGNDDGNALVIGVCPLVQALVRFGIAGRQPFQRRPSPSDGRT